MSQSSQIPEHILDEATDWLVLIYSGEMSEIEQQQFEQWQAEKKEHALAIQQIRHFTHGLTDPPIVSLQSHYYSPIKILI